MFIGTPCILKVILFHVFNNTKNRMVSKMHIFNKTMLKIFCIIIHNVALNPRMNQEVWIFTWEIFLPHS